ncbi:MAG: cation:proton antiporter, partial [Candidatus Micrarchaeia archaeon]
MAELFAEFGVIVFFALAGGLLATRFRQPSVLGLLLAGAVIGPNALGLVTQTDLVNTLADLGAALLLFTIGIEFSISKLLKVGVGALAIATAKVAFVFVVTYEAALIMGMTLFEALIIGALLSITSTAIVARVLADKGMKRRPETSMLIAVLVMEDVLAVFLLTFFSALRAGNGAVGSDVTHDLLLPFITSFVVLALAYLILQRVLKAVFEWIVKYRTSESLILAALAMAVGLSYGAQMIGLAPSIGAFVAGSIAVTLPGGHAIERGVKPFSAVFSALFFLSMGILINPPGLMGALPLVLILGAVSIAAKFFGMGIATYFEGMSGRSAIFAGLAMLSAGEFSLLLAKEASGLVPFDIIGVTALIVFMSTLATSGLIGSSDRIYRRIERVLPPGAHTQLLQVSQYFGNVMRRFEPGGQFFVTFREEGRSLVANVSVVVLVLGFAAIISPYVAAYSLDAFGLSVPVVYLLFAAAVMAVIYPIAYALDAFKDILDELSASFLRTRYMEGSGLNVSVMHKVIFLAAALFVAVQMPLILSVLRLEGMWWISLIPLFAAFLALWEIVREVHVIFDKRIGREHSGKIEDLLDVAGLPLLKFERLRVRKK